MGGLAGRALAKLALSKKYLVAGTVHKNFPEELRGFIKTGEFRYYQVDLQDLNKLRDTIKDFTPDVLVHFAGKALGASDSQTANPKTYQENIKIFKNVLSAVKGMQKKPKFILTSGCLVYDQTANPSQRKESSPKDLPGIDPKLEPYRASRLDQEKLLVKENLDYIITRPSQFTGPGKIKGVIEWYLANQISEILKGQISEIKLRNKLSEVDMLDVRDVAYAYITLIEKGLSGEVYHISTGQPTTVENLAKVFLEVVRLNPKAIPIISTAIEKATFFRFSPKKLNRLGWRPKFSLKDSLLSYWEYFKTL